MTSFVGADSFIDGSSQTTFTGDSNPFGPEISIDGSLAGGGVDGLTLGFRGTANSLNVHSFSGIGVVGMTRITVGEARLMGSYIGTDATGTVDLGNGGAGVTRISQVGGTSAGEGNVISGNGGHGVDTGRNDVVEGNFIGTTADGTEALGNGGNGIYVGTGASNVRIGGTDPGARNIISGNTRGIQVFSGSATGALIQGNYIGTDVTGMVDLGNSSHGVDIDTNIAVPWAVIGGTDPGAGNLISGNGANGILGWSVGIVIQGNLIGTDVSGTSALANDFAGIQTSNAQIGGTTAAARNVVSGNGALGVSAGNESIVQGNYIGLDITGSVAIGNLGDGLVTGNNTTVGGTTAGAGNVISGNAGQGIAAGSGSVIQGNLLGTDATGTVAIISHIYHHHALSLSGAGGMVGGNTPGAANVFANSRRGNGIHISGSNHIILGNFIGTDKTATIDLGNAGHGIAIQALFSPITFGNQIGGTAEGEGNVIAHNGLTGVLVFSDAGTIGNPIRGNSIFDNASELGIDLGSTEYNSQADNWLGDGVTPNDATMDIEPGDGTANNFQNYPVLTAVASGANTQVAGTLHSLVSTTFDLDFYANSVADSSGNGEGERYLASIQVTTSASGDASFDETLSAVTGAGEFVTATATDPGGNTSEFSTALVTSGPAFDFGDAPDPGYPTLLASDGARHQLGSGLLLGAAVDADVDGQQDAIALGDDNDGSDDEDGVFFQSAFIKGQTTFVDVVASAPGVLNAWADFGNGWVGPSEQIFTDQPLAAGINNLSFPVADSGIEDENAALRFRFSSQSGLGTGGAASDGEIEDYVMVRRGSGNMDPDNDGVDAAVEDAGPNGGDGNNDGIPDSIQLNVTSIPNFDGSEYLVIQSQPGTVLTNVSTADPSTLGTPPAGVSFPLGALRFNVEGFSPGAAVEVEILLPAGVTVSTYFKYGDEPGMAGDHWYEFLDDGSTGASILPGKVVLKLVDGGRGDDDITANGVIIDPGAAGVVAVIFFDGFEN